MLKDNLPSYRYNDNAAGQIYAAAQRQVGALPANAATKCLVAQAIEQLNAVAGSLAVVGREMRRLASLLPEAAVVGQMYGVGPTLGPQLMAEIGDVRRFHSKKALVAFAGIDARPTSQGALRPKSARSPSVAPLPYAKPCSRPSAAS